jgi:hypothetical protein
MRLFTVEEANALIPKLEIIMARLQRCGAELRAGVEAVAEESGRSIEALTMDDIMARRPTLTGVADEIKQLVAEIEAQEVHFKGIDLGLVDFPAEIDGDFALLCWQYGEKEITYWHTLEGGFAARRPLPDVPDRSYLQ